MTSAREAAGESKTRLYNIWLHMRRRCTRPTDPAYERYGGRGLPPHPLTRKETT